MAFLTNHFEARDHSRYAERLRQQKWFIKARQDRQKQRADEEARQDDMLDFSAGMILATQMQIETFQQNLDKYDAATIQALELNQQQIDEITEQLLIVRARIQDKLQQAHIMEDGRRVFLTEDRSQAFDEHGNEVSPEELDFDAISEAAPSWEGYQKEIQREEALSQSLEKLETERGEILDYQEKLDHARERSEADDFTTDELEELEKDLEESMPDAVAKQLPDYEPSQTQDLKSDFTTSATPKVAPINQTPAITPTTLG